MADLQALSLKIAQAEEFENVLATQTREMWSRWKMIFYSIFTAAAIRYINIHNQVTIIFSSMILLLIFYFIRHIAARLPYHAVGGLLYETADMLVALFQIFTATSVGNGISGFITTDGSLNIRSANKIFILMELVFIGILVLPKYFHLPRARPNPP